MKLSNPKTVSQLINDSLNYVSSLFEIKKLLQIAPMLTAENKISKDGKNQPNLPYNLQVIRLLQN